MTWSVPRLWKGETGVILGGGPSLTQEDVDYCRGKARVIAINNSYEMAPWADVLYACDKRWWATKANAKALEFEGMKITLTEPISDKVHGLKYPTGDKGRTGLSLDPTELRTGRNGGYQSINLYVLFGVIRILLLGFDMRVVKDRTHWHNGHGNALNPSVLKSFIPNFDTLKQPLAELGVEVVNCTPDSALETFPKMELREAL